MAVIEFDRVSKRFGDGTVAVDDFNLRIEDNELRKDAPIIFINAHDSSISHNVSVGSVGSGIFFGGNVRRFVVTHNVLRDGAFTGINLRSDPADYGPGAAAPDTDNRISHNTISGFGEGDAQP